MGQFAAGPLNHRLAVAVAAVVGVAVAPLAMTAARPALTINGPGLSNYWRAVSTEIVALATKAPYIGPGRAFKR